MVRIFLLSGLFILLAQVALAQESFGVGVGFSYDYGLKFARSAQYEPYTRGETGGISFDGYIRLPLGPISISPAYFITIPNRTLLINNTVGEYIPEGYSVARPYQANSPDFYTSRAYPDLSAQASIVQQTYGSFFILNLGEYVGIGSGLFMRNRTTTIYQDYLYDQYFWAGNDANFDYYDYWETGYAGTTEETRITHDLTIPLLINIEGNWRGFSSGTSFIYWMGGGDNYISFRYTVGLAF